MARPRVPSNVACYHCGALETSKAGFSEKKQRFYCRACRRFFRENPEGRLSPNYRRSARKDLPSAGHLIPELRSIEQRLGTTPTTTLITELSKQGLSRSLNTYYAVFGSSLTALKRAKIKPVYKQEFDETDRERMLGDLRRLRAKLKRPIYEADVVEARRKRQVSSPYHMARAFGSVPEAIKAAGAGEKKYSRDEMIAFLRRLDKRLDRNVKERDIQAEFHAGRGPSERAIAREFGGIVKARKAARIAR